MALGGLLPLNFHDFPGQAVKLTWACNLMSIIQGGPLPVISGAITPVSRVKDVIGVTRATHLFFGHLLGLYSNSTYTWIWGTPWYGVYPSVPWWCGNSRQHWRLEEYEEKGTSCLTSEINSVRVHSTGRGHVKGNYIPIVPRVQGFISFLEGKWDPLFQRFLDLLR